MIAKDALQLAVDVCQHAASPTFVKSDKLPDKVFLVTPGGETKEFAVPPPPEIRKVGSVESFVLAVEKIGAAESTVLVGRTITADRPNDPDMSGFFLDVISLPLTETEAFESLGRQRAPALLVQDLKYLFDVQDSALFGKLRNLKFRQVDEATVSAERNRESLGISVEREVGSGDGLPEEVEISIQVFDEFDHRTTALVGFLPDHKNHTLALKLLSETKKSLIRESLVAAVDHLRAKLPESTVLLG